MASAVIMPKEGITVETCVISEWRKKAGDPVEIGDILFTYETDKAMFECASTVKGELLETFYSSGDEVPVLTPVCAVGAKGEDVSALRPAGSGAASSEAAPKAAEKAPEEKVAPILPEAPVASENTGKVSPRAKNLAERAGVDVAPAAGTGPSGRVIERDVRKLMADGTAEIASATAPTPQLKTEIPVADYEDIKFSGIRKMIAKSMFQSLQNTAQLTHNHSFDATDIQNYRARLKDAGGEFAGITLGDMVLFAVTRTLLSHPDLNAHLLEGDVLRRFRSVNLGVAVDTPRGLMVPTVFGAEKKSLLELSREVKELAVKCREGSISPDTLTGGTFTVSNLGVTGVESFTPVLNPPQTGILGVCGITQRVREVGGVVAVYPAMGLSFTYDHRAVDGAPASRFAKELCENLEHFIALLAV